MNKLKFVLFSVVVLALLGLLGYWAFVAMQSGTQFKNAQKIKQLEEENSDLTEQVADLTSRLDEALSELAVFTTPAETPKKENPTPSPKENITYKNQSLINDLQKLIDDNIYMKLKSSGTRVGTVQKFLNIYNNTSNKIDNDYGTTMQKRIIAFQKDQGLKADGEAGPSTFSKMIGWLKKQG